METGRCAYGNSKVSFSYFSVHVLNQFFNTYSEYPSKRSVKASDGSMEGVAGNLKLIQEVGVADQPITSFSWSADKLGLAACTSFDQTIRIIAVPNLNCL